jgi:hypothetical protein
MQNVLLSNESIEMLGRIKIEILKEPRQFLMSSFYADSQEFGCWDIPNCGTAACIGGWGYAIKHNLSPALASCQRRVMLDHRLAIGINGEQATRLFFMEEWPQRFRETDAMPGTPEFAKNAADRIDHFIATDGEE